jgi:glyoxylase-like metal-dependent hydrolase (beta-lactamase superfamily II)
VDNEDDDPHHEEGLRLRLLLPRRHREARPREVRGEERPREIPCRRAVDQPPRRRSPGRRDDEAFAGKDALNEWQFAADASGEFDGVLDVFGEGSVWARWVPRHTPGSTAYLVRTKSGPVLLTGDACHTRWGWEHHVEPGTFNGDLARAAVSFQRLQKFAAAQPKIEVRFGHQR